MKKNGNVGIGAMLVLLLGVAAAQASAQDSLDILSCRLKVKDGEKEYQSSALHIVLDDVRHRDINYDPLQVVLDDSSIGDVRARMFWFQPKFTGQKEFKAWIYVEEKIDEQFVKKADWIVMIDQGERFDRTTADKKFSLSCEPNKYVKQ